MGDNKSGGGGVMEKQSMLTNLPGGKSEAADVATKVGPRILSESESYRVEITNLGQQVMTLKQDLLNSQKKILGLQEDNLNLQKGIQAKDTEKLLADLGLVGSVNLVKNDDGRYVVNTGK